MTFPLVWGSIPSLSIWKATWSSCVSSVTTWGHSENSWCEKRHHWRILCGDLVVPHDFDTFRAEWEAPSPHLSDSRSGRKESWVRRQLDQVSSTSSTSSAPSFCSICLCWSDSMSAGCQYCLWETLINRSVIGLTGGRATHCVRECMCVWLVSVCVVLQSRGWWRCLFLRTPTAAVASVNDHSLGVKSVRTPEQTRLHQLRRGLHVNTTLLFWCFNALELKC